MGYLAEKYNYVKGLCDGLGMNDTETKEGKLLAAVMELLDEMVLSVEDLEDSRDEMNEILDEIDEDLSELEETVYDDYDNDNDDEDEDDDGECIEEVECPECNTLFKFTEDIFSEDGNSITCPICKKTIEVEWEDCDCDDCDCHDE